MIGLLGHDDFLKVVRDTPLVAIDLIVVDGQGRALLGERRNAPAQGFWFVPGGRIRKDETLQAAFERITRIELGTAFPMQQAVWQGVYEHLYDDNFALQPGVSTHYVVLAYRLSVADVQLPLPDVQHSSYRWAEPEELLRDPSVHRNTQAYFLTGCEAG